MDLEALYAQHPQTQGSVRGELLGGERYATPGVWVEGHPHTVGEFVGRDLAGQSVDVHRPTAGWPTASREVAATWKDHDDQLTPAA